MAIFLNSALAGLAFLLGTIPILLTWRLKRHLGMQPISSLTTRYHPPATVILPCKGLDPGFEKNIRSLLDQDYPDLELLFVVAAEDDPAYSALKLILTESSVKRAGLRTSLLVAGFSRCRAQKLTNQLAAVACATTASEVLVFVDSDCRPDPAFIRRLVGPLGDSRIGATTGYRWYNPPRSNLGSLLRSTWNAGALPFLVDPKRVFAWGGAMAIRRDTFDRAEIANAWKNAVSDDMTLTVAVRSLGLEVRFVPDCIAVSYESSTLAETIEFTNRQSLISRVYFPPLWWGTAIGHASANLLILYGLICLGLWAHSGESFLLVGSACSLLLPMQLANARWLFGSARDLLPVAIHRDLDQLRMRYVLAAPLASMMTLVNTVHSLSTRRMTWRGIQYELRSPTETIVFDKSGRSQV